MYTWSWQYAADLFVGKDRNEVIKMTYKVTISAIIHQWESIIFTPDHLILWHHNRPERILDLWSRNQRISLRDAFESILERDDIIRSHFQLEEKTKPRTIYRIIQQPDVTFSLPEIQTGPGPM